MTTSAFTKISEGLKEALEVVRGDAVPARWHVCLTRAERQTLELALLRSYPAVQVLPLEGGPKS